MSSRRRTELHRLYRDRPMEDLMSIRAHAEKLGTRKAAEHIEIIDDILDVEM